MAKDKCSSRGWGYLAANVPDPRACITDCRWQLLQAIVPSNETLGEACKALSDSRRSSNDQVFRMVYCCDSQICGVDNLEGRGKDRECILPCQPCHRHELTESSECQLAHKCLSKVEIPHLLSRIGQWSKAVC